jgi:hypothetical protein
MKILPRFSAKVGSPSSTISKNTLKETKLRLEIKNF